MVGEDIDAIIGKSSPVATPNEKDAKDKNEASKDSKSKDTETKTKEAKPNSHPDSLKIGVKDFFDTIGFGFSSQQFLNIFFMLSGAGYFLLGTVNALKSVLSVITSAVVQSYKKSEFYCKFASIFSGLLLAFSILLMALAQKLESTILFSILLILSGMFVAVFGDFYLKYKKQHMSKPKSSYLKFSAMFSKYSIVLTAASLLVAGYTLDNFSNLNLKIFGIVFHSSILVLGISALSFLLGVLLLFLSKADKKEDVDSLENRPVFSQAYFTVKKTFISFKNFTKDKTLAILIFSSMILATVQVLGNSFYGIYIYQNLTDFGFGKYLNVAVVFLIAALTSLIGPVISKINAKEYGKVPMLVFGTMLMAITPLAFFMNPNIMSIAMGIIIGVIGAAISGVAHGLLAADLVPELQRQEYFSSLGMFSILPCLITVPLGAYVAQVFGLKILFLILGILILITSAMYFSIVLISNKDKIKI